MLRISFFFFVTLSAALAQSPFNLPAQVGPSQPARAFTLGQKFNYRVVQSMGTRGLVGAALGAAIGQAMNTPSEWGQGMEGFGKRYGSGFAGTLTRQSMEFAAEGILHQDPRYFPSERKGFKARLKNVLLQTVVTRTDGGRYEFAYARVGSAFGNGLLVNAWQPRSNNSFGDGITRGLISLGSDAGFNFLQEFVPFLRPKSLKRP
jgi:hypothetical protein